MGSDKEEKPAKRGYFTEATPAKLTFYFFALILLITFAGVALVDLFISTPCDDKSWTLKYPNPEYRRQPCQWRRHPTLLYLTQMECEWARRLLVAGLLGAVIGFERRSPDRPAGIRTMVTVSVGAALFTLNSMFAFLSGPMEWDSSRVSAALPSGVGFLGAAVIWKQTTEDGKQNINGVTTAASVWLSAAVGTAAGGGLHVSALFTVLITINLLRFGPRMDRKEEEEESEDDNVAPYEGADLARKPSDRYRGPPPLPVGLPPDAGEGAAAAGITIPQTAPVIDPGQVGLASGPSYSTQYGSFTPAAHTGMGARTQSWSAAGMPRAGRTPKARTAHFAS
eukprot:TRINITY_DN51264_c0_g1_i1.p1 TRINITY_DN51264_c0_g1~~TRINITY_DN51264_c0_g1_i1.p1  ORF type:complete len:372 (+),score=86.72 TRINITY_DN51264_c0_g1_i1:105-1118(+)